MLASQKEKKHNVLPVGGSGQILQLLLSAKRTRCWGGQGSGSCREREKRQKDEGTEKEKSEQESRGPAPHRQRRLMLSRRRAEPAKHTAAKHTHTHTHTHTQRANQHAVSRRPPPSLLPPSLPPFLSKHSATKPASPLHRGRVGAGGGGEMGEKTCVHVCVRLINSRLREDTRSPSTPPRESSSETNLCISKFPEAYFILLLFVFIAGV